MEINNQTLVVFDLDDTLYKEIDFVKSAYKEISRIIELQTGTNIYDELFFLFKKKADVFDFILKKYPTTLSLQDLIDVYRYHIPNIQPVKEIIRFINKCNDNVSAFCLITDGKSVTQRNKLKALGLIDLFKDNLYISQEVGYTKINEYSFLSILNKYPNNNFIYFADNAKKDFLIPNKLGWVTYQIQDINNIHDSFIEVPNGYAAQNKITYKFFENEFN